MGIAAVHACFMRGNPPWATFKNTRILFVCLPWYYYKHCLESLLGLTMVSREIENNAYVKFWRDNKKYYGFFENGPYCTQIPQEKHAWNTRVKNTRENTRKLGKRVCKSLHAGCYNLRAFGLLEFLHRWLSECICTCTGGGFNLLA